MNEPAAKSLTPTTKMVWHAYPHGLSGDILRKKDGTGRVFQTEAAALRAARNHKGDLHMGTHCCKESNCAGLRPPHGRAQTFDHLQENVKNAAHGPVVDTTAFRDAAAAFAFAYIAECIRLGVIGGTWAAMRNTLVLGAATTPLHHQCASWELETCPGSDAFLGSDQPLRAAPCRHCFQNVPSNGLFRAAHKRALSGRTA